MSFPACLQNVCRSANPVPQGTWVITSQASSRRHGAFSQGGGCHFRTSVKGRKLSLGTWDRPLTASCLPRIRPEEEHPWSQLGFGWPVGIYSWRLTWQGGHQHSVLCVTLDQAPHFCPSTFSYQEERDWLGSSAFNEPSPMTVAPNSNQNQIVVIGSGGCVTSFRI